MASIIIDLDDNRIFHVSEWIGISKNHLQARKPYTEDAKEVLLVAQHFQHHGYFLLVRAACFAVCCSPAWNLKRNNINQTSHMMKKKTPNQIRTPCSSYPKSEISSYVLIWRYIWPGIDWWVEIGADLRFNDGKDRIAPWDITPWLQLSKVSSSQANWSSHGLFRKCNTDILVD